MIVREELIEISTIEEFKVQYRKRYQKFWPQRDLLLIQPNIENMSLKAYVV